MLVHPQRENTLPVFSNEDTDNKISEGAPQRILTIHDLSCLGRCALTVIIPVLSVMGFQTIPLPTAVLSTHTGGFSDFVFLDLSDKMREIADHWKKLNITFDAIYTGFLGNEVQCDLINDVIENFGASRKKAIILVDPVMGDEGKLYKTITPVIGKKMKVLISKADVITPNVTEACFLLGMDYKAPSDNAEILDMSKRLCEMGATCSVITGICLYSDRIATACYNSKTGSFDICENPRLPQQYPGTGDVFASVLLGELMRGKELSVASAAASGFVYNVMVDTSYDSTGHSIDDNRYGIYLEKHLKDLI